MEIIQRHVKTNALKGRLTHKLVGLKFGSLFVTKGIFMVLVNILPFSSLNL